MLMVNPQIVEPELFRKCRGQDAFVSERINLCDREPEREAEVMEPVSRHIRQFSGAIRRRFGDIMSKYQRISEPNKPDGSTAKITPSGLSKEAAVNQPGFERMLWGSARSQNSSG